MSKTNTAAAIYESELVPAPHLHVVPAVEPEFASPLAETARLPISLRPWNVARRAAESRLARVATVLAIGASALASTAELTLPKPVQSLIVSNAEALYQDITNTAPQTNERTDTPYQSFVFKQADYGTGNGDYKNSHVGDEASLWPTILALDGSYTHTLARSPHKAGFENAYSQTFEGLVNYRNPADGRYYVVMNAYRGLPFVIKSALYDDEAWTGEQMIRHYLNNHDSASLLNAKEILGQEIKGWDSRDGGGNYWQVQTPGATHYRAAISNNTVADLSFNIWEATGKRNPKYLDITKKYFNWTMKTLYDPSSGEFDDHISPTGKVDHTARSYNQGEEALDMADLSTVNMYSAQKTINFVKHTLRHFNDCNGYDVPAFRGIMIEDFMKVVAKLKVTTKVKADGLIAGIRQCMANAIKFLPRQPDNLQDAAGADLVKALPEVPLAKWGDLS